MTKNNSKDNSKDNRCAPSKSFQEGSCFTLDNLKYITEQINSNYFKNNNKYNNKYTYINPNMTKKKLLKELLGFFKSKYMCEDQLCWLKTPFLQSHADSDILKNTFRPNGPDKGKQWLSNFDINNSMKQYEKKYKEFKFFQAAPDDFANLKYLEINNHKNGKNNYNELWDKLKTQNKYKLGTIFNTDTSNGGGQHWNALYFDLNNGEINFFDSVGVEPSANVKKFIDKLQSYFTLKNIKSKYKYNNIQHQFKNSECGVYSMNFIIRRLNGETFENITNNITLDDNMNSCRSKYFT
jgi:hypothetical protein